MNFENTVKHKDLIFKIYKCQNNRKTSDPKFNQININTQIIVYVYILIVLKITLNVQR